MNPNIPSGAIINFSLINNSVTAKSLNKDGVIIAYLRSYFLRSAGLWFPGTHFYFSVSLLHTALSQHPWLAGDQSDDHLGQLCHQLQQKEDVFCMSKGKRIESVMH